ncbi:MAG: DUF4258 domain-containing protein [Dehalococcoidia bacterium]
MPYFEVTTVLGKRIRTTKPYWEKLVTTKHPRIRDREKEVQEALQKADEVRRSTVDSSVYLYYKLYYKKERECYICAVAKHINDEGFLITAYFTQSIKIGEVIWTK